jgi:hypothetical protein
MADGRVDGKMTKKGTTYEVNQAFIDKLRKDFLTLIGNIKRIKTDRDREMVRKGFQAWRKYFEKTIFKNWLNNKDVKGESWGYAVRKPAWDFYLELTLPEDPNQWKNWEKRVRRKGQVVWKELKDVAARWERQREMELQYGLEGESLTLPPRGEAPSEERVTLEGFTVVLIGLQLRTGDHPSDYDQRIRELEKFKSELKRYKGQAAKHFPLLLKAKIPIYFDYTMGLDKGGDYDLYEGNKLRVNPSSTVSSGDKDAVWVLAHEMSHHIWKTFLGGEAHKLWDTMLGGTADLDLTELMHRWPEEITYTSDFVRSMSDKDPIYALRVDVASGWQDATNLWKREDFQKLLAEGTRSVKVPAIPISAYAGKNQEEAFCEAIGALVSRGPRAIHPKVRWVLSLMFPGQIRMAFVVLARYLESKRG